MAKLVGLNVEIPESIRDKDLKALKASVAPLVPKHLKKPSQDDLVGILIQQANALKVAKAVERYYKFKHS
jgi:hypothetical protein